MTEFRLVRAALAMLAAGAAAHSLFGGPGTTLGDHVVPGLVPVGAALLLAALYPLLPAGARGAAAVSCGALGVVAGVALRDAAGLLGIAGGVALLAVGAGVLWRSRRVDGSPAARYARRGARGIAAVAFVYFVLVPVGVAIVATHRDRVPPPAADLGTTRPTLSS